MKILIIRSYPSIVDLKASNYNQQEIGLATAFQKKGHTVGIVYFGGNNHVDDVYKTAYGDISIYYRKAKVYLGKIALYEEFSDLKESYDMLILNEYDQIETAKTLKKYSSKAIIYHGPYYCAFNKRYNMYNKMFDILYLRGIRKRKPIIFTKSKLAMEYLQSKGLAVKDFVGVGLDKNQLHKNVEENNPYETLIEGDKKNLLYIGKLEERRNVIFLLECLKELVKLNDDYRLIMVGNGEATYKEKVFEFIKSNDLEKYVVYKEKIEQMYLPYIYKNSEIFLLPTSFEIWGMVLMEAMLCNCPVVTTFNGGSSSLIKNGYNGMIIEELDVEKWVNTIANTKYDDLTLKEYNEKVIEEKCDWTRIADRMLEAFMEKRN